MANTNILFHLSRGNPSNDPLGLSIGGDVFGKSLGGEIFRSENLPQAQTTYHKLRDGSQDVFDPIVPSDIIKNQVNYRAIYITNIGADPFVLDEISISNVVYDGFVGFPITDVEIAVEGVFLLTELQRAVPTVPGKPGNPSLVLDDEYDSTNKFSLLPVLSFKKTLTSIDLPSDIPAQGAVKIWLKRTTVVDKLNMPDDELLENVTLSVTEYDTNDVTSLQIDYKKIEGRISLSNWFDFTITPGKGNPFVMHELLPKSVDISSFNIIDVFVVNKKILLFYKQTPSGAVTTYYYLLVIDPNDVAENNKYVQVQLLFETGINDNQEYIRKEINSIEKSFFDDNKFYIFWDEEVSINDPCTLFFFGFYERFDRIAIDELFTYLWTDNIFVNIKEGWDNRRIETYNLLDRKVVRENTLLLNLQQIDDLFILFTQDTSNKGLIDLEEINLNRNQLLYLFEKDIENPQENSEFKNYPGAGAEVLSQRLLPESLPKLTQITPKNVARNVFNDAIISSSTSLSRNLRSPREIKFLLDGSRYVDENSMHGREFKLGNQFYTYELPIIDNRTTSLTSILVNTGIKITNDTAIYNNIKTVFGTADQISNVVGDEIFERPWFQKNIIDESSIGSLSIPVEWADRNYKDEWIKLLSTSPDPDNSTSPVPLIIEYNFARNLWRSIIIDEDGNDVITIHNLFEDQDELNTDGKPYMDLTIKDLPYVIEPGHYQPLSIRIVVRNIFSGQFNVSRYVINYNIYFKGKQIFRKTAYSSNISNLSYLFINPDKTLNISVNYLDIFDAEKIPVNYYVSNLHQAILNQINYRYSPEFKVDPQIQTNQSSYKYYRVISLDGFIPPAAGEQKSGEVIVPVILYGNGYKNESGSALNENLEVRNPFDFSKISINDRSIRIYGSNNTKTPLEFKIGHYDYDRDYAVLWVRMKDIGISNTNLFIYYGKIDITEDYKDVLTTYSYLSKHLYPTGSLGAWHFDRIVDDSRISFRTGAIYKAGDPIIYEKSFNNELRLTRIEKEYFYGIAKIYKSNYFNIDLDVQHLEDDTLFFDEDKQERFVQFIKDSASVFKPGYTEINNVKPMGFEVLEAGEGGAGVSDNRRVDGLIALTSNENVNVYYDRIDQSKFDLKTSYNGYSNLIDWVVAKPLDTSVFKSGTYKVSGKLKSETIKFDFSFPNTDYFVFVHSPSNQKLYWNQLCESRFTVSASHTLTKEISWMAFHRDVFGGVFTPDSIFVGKRVITGSTTTTATTGTTGTSGSPEIEPNLDVWVDNTLVIKPEIGVFGDPGEMTVDPTDPGYSILLSSNENINMYWTEKESDRFVIKTSAPVPCTIHWAVIRNGIEWWQELI